MNEAIKVSQKKISILYKYIDGAHFFVSETSEAAGLCVASKDLLQAFTEVGLQLAAIYQHNHGVKTQFKPAIQFEEFKHLVECLRSACDDVDSDGLVIPASIQPWLANAALKGSTHAIE
jgi:hypothetical protein